MDIVDIKSTTSNPSSSYSAPHMDHVASLKELSLRQNDDFFRESHYNRMILYRRLANEFKPMILRAHSRSNLNDLNLFYDFYNSLANSHQFILESFINEKILPVDFMILDPIDYAIKFNEKMAREANDAIQKLEKSKESTKFPMLTRQMEYQKLHTKFVCIYSIRIYYIV